MNKRRLLKLADLLEADANNPKGMKFDIRTVAEAKTSDQIGVSCNTAGCAMGLAAMSGAFKRAGMEYRIKAPCSPGDTAWINIYDKHGSGFDEVGMRIFDLTEDQAFWLFMPESYRKKVGKAAELEVARRIRGLVSGELKAPVREVSW